MSAGDEHLQGILGEKASAYLTPGEGEVDPDLLRVSLAMTPWERMLANDDALNFAESLRAAVAKRNAKPQ